MAWTTPPTFVAGDPLAAAELNVLGDDLLYVKGVSDGASFSGVKLSRDATQSIPNATQTAVTMITEVFDFGGWWTSGAVATVPASAVPAGFSTIIVEVVLSARLATNGTGTRQIYLMHNGSEADVLSYSAIGGEATTIALTTFLEVAAGDTIGLAVKQNSGGALDTHYNRMAIVREAPASV
jgi:hypothetical protein